MKGYDYPLFIERKLKFQRPLYYLCAGNLTKYRYD